MDMNALMQMMQRLFGGQQGGMQQSSMFNQRKSPMQQSNQTTPQGNMASPLQSILGGSGGGQTGGFNQGGGYREQPFQLGSDAGQPNMGFQQPQAGTMGAMGGQQPNNPMQSIMRIMQGAVAR